ncbi:MAG TPA: low affinity iron permease family protein [Pyrinomonadaceae bacterium]|nr:low affinity iron permease family protein [Pyrinomonadaceae bacterium]
MATCHQHQHDDRNLPDGLSDSARAKQDAQAIHIKLNEIVAALQGASNRLIDVEDLTEEEIETLHRHYQKLVQMAKKDMKLTQSHSVEEAEVRHKIKHK